jgi:cytochrome P450
MASKWILFRDPPDHTRLRALVSAACTPRIVQALAPRIADIAEGLLDEVEQTERVPVREPQRPRLPSGVPRSVVAVDGHDGRQERIASHDRRQVYRHQGFEDEVLGRAHGRSDGGADALHLHILRARRSPRSLWLMGFATQVFEHLRLSRGEGLKQHPYLQAEPFGRGDLRDRRP